MDFTGILNENSYFSDSFFTTGMAAELADPVARWSEKGDASPVARLNRLASAYPAKVDALRGLNDPETRREARGEATRTVMEALGYPYHRVTLDLSTGQAIPVVGRVAGPDGRDLVWILEAPTPAKGETHADPLGQGFDIDQFPPDDRNDAATDDAIEVLLNRGIYDLRLPPKHVLVLGLTQAVLTTRDRWHRHAVLRFDLAEIFERREEATLATMACLLSCEALAPDTGIPLIERLAEEAQRYANQVTSSLKATVRDAIEILGQEVLDVTGGKYPKGHPRFDTWIRDEDLTLEALRMMYRLLFLFYVEANPKLGIVDLSDRDYASGYSLEGLRALETRALRTQEEKTGTYLWDSLTRLVTLMFEGTGDLSPLKTFSIQGARVALLDPDATPILSNPNVRLRNVAVQKIIRLLSLKTGKNGTGRISYAQLGIGQLGAVYETLISFTGFVCKQDMIQILPKEKKGAAADDAEDETETDDDETEADDAEDGDAEESGYRRDDAKDIDRLAPAWFVPKSRAKEFPRERVVYAGPEPLVYKKGTFVYRLAGRDRQKSASYYTPEPLARLLVKHALDERCKGLKADDLLDLKILEPAMGSAAFMAETVNQLADRYLEMKQAETGRTIPQEEWYIERQKVRAYLADRNCYGVDLNPIAMELAQITLWLNGLHASDYSPWFPHQLHAGNSLVGARKAAYAPELLTAKKKADGWLEQKPTEIGWKAKRPDGHVWQFLLPAPGMVDFDGDKEIKPIAGAEQAKIKAWRKAGWEKPLNAEELRLVQRLSRVVDDLFEAAADELESSRRAFDDPITLWPDKHMPGTPGLDHRRKAQVLRVLRGEEHVGNTLPYKRLKTAMDAWCALWTWPLDQVDRLPSRTLFLNSLKYILEGGSVAGDEDEAPLVEKTQGDLFATVTPEEAERIARELRGKTEQNRLFRDTDVEAFVAETPWLQVAKAVAEKERFVHLDLIFADVLRARRGFDIIVGNPPWAKPSWNAGDVIADIDPLHIGLTARQVKDKLPDVLSDKTRRNRFLAEYASTRGAMAVTSSPMMQPFAGGGSNNLYRCFVDLAFRLVSENGCAAMIHQDGHLGDPESRVFRHHWFARVAKHFDHSNKIKNKNFAEVVDHVRFSLNVYRGRAGGVSFDQVTYALLASQVEESYRHDGIGPIPPIKTLNDRGKWAWDTRGHRDRVIRIDHDVLSTIHALAEDETVPVEETRFVQPYSRAMLDVFRLIASFDKLKYAVPTVEKIIATEKGDRKVQVNGWQIHRMWHETEDDKLRGNIRRETSFKILHDSILQGPHFHVANPLYKTPRSRSRTNADYDVIDHASIPEDYISRTNYGPAIDHQTYKERLPACRWNANQKHSEFFRIAFRRAINLNSERSLISAIIPPRVSHVDGIESLTFRDEEFIPMLAAVCASIIIDFWVKASGLGDMRESSASRIPFPKPPETAIHRVLRLNCLTSSYAELWDRHAPSLTPLPWSSDDPRLALEGSVEGPATWDRTAGLRTEFARRMALVEIDVLVAQAMGLSLDQLVEIYQVYFPVLQENEAGTWYDQKGRIVWTCSKGLPGVGYLEKGKSPGRKAWDKILESEPATLTCKAWDDTQPGGRREVTRTFEGPFTTYDRVKDYRRAWAYFEAFR